MKQQLSESFSTQNDAKTLETDFLQALNRFLERLLMEVLQHAQSILTVKVTSGYAAVFIDMKIFTL